jgi:hypothetical protein
MTAFGNLPPQTVVPLGTRRPAEGADREHLAPAQPAASPVWAQWAARSRPGSFSSTPCALNQGTAAAKRAPRM